MQRLREAFAKKAKSKEPFGFLLQNKAVNCRQYGSLLSALLTPPVKSLKYLKMPDVPAVLILFFVGMCFFGLADILFCFGAELA